MEATAEGVASVAHVLTIRLLNGTVWNEAIVTAGSRPREALLGSLAAMAPPPSPSGTTEAAGWRAQLADGPSLGLVELALVRKDAAIPDDQVASACAPPAGCDTLRVRVPQLPAYTIKRDEKLRLTVDGWATRGGPASGPSARATTDVVIKAKWPCAELSSCGTCVAHGGGSSAQQQQGDDASDPRGTGKGAYACAWCASSSACVPRRDGGLLPGECAGMIESTCGGEAPPGPAPYAEPSLRRFGVGVHVLNLGEIDLRAAKFYADVQIFVRVEADANGDPKVRHRTLMATASAISPARMNTPTRSAA